MEQANSGQARQNMSIRVYGPNGVTIGTGARAKDRVDGPAFVLPSEDGPGRTKAAQAPRALASVDTLLAVQAVDDRRERRKRAMKAGHAVLDALDEVKIGVLADGVDSRLLSRLSDAAALLAARAPEGTGESGLDRLLADIELRVSVELAKWGRKP
jgi:hypothetical protein